MSPASVGTYSRLHKSQIVINAIVRFSLRLIEDGVLLIKAQHILFGCFRCLFRYGYKLQGHYKMRNLI